MGVSLANSKTPAILRAEIILKSSGFSGIFLRGALIGVIALVGMAAMISWILLLLETKQKPAMR